MKISVVCPFYNEEAIIEKAIEGMANALETLNHDWELILVNDGSVDNSFALADGVASKYPYVKIIGYELNRGRGYALRHGISHSVGDIVVTTEVDLSWGDDIVHRLIEAFEEHPDADMIVASPNLSGGGYRNVSARRVLVSRIGNMVIRAGQSGSMTMYTGMTRAYRRTLFLSMPIDEDEKEFHLEVAQKAQAYGFKIYEIPCHLEWKEHRLAKAGFPKRKSSSRMPKLIRTHMIFAAAAAPFRYIFPVSAFTVFVSFVFMLMAIVNLFNEIPSAFLFIAALVLFLIALIFFSVGMLSYQNKQTQKDVWRLRREIRILAQTKEVGHNF